MKTITNKPEIKKKRNPKNKYLFKVFIDYGTHTEDVTGWVDRSQIDSGFETAKRLLEPNAVAVSGGGGRTEWVSDTFLKSLTRECDGQSCDGCNQCEDEEYDVETCAYCNEVFNVWDGYTIGDLGYKCSDCPETFYQDEDHHYRLGSDHAESEEVSNILNSSKDVEAFRLYRLKNELIDDLIEIYPDPHCCPVSVQAELFEKVSSILDSNVCLPSGTSSSYGDGWKVQVRKSTTRLKCRMLTKPEELEGSYTFDREKNAEVVEITIQNSSWDALKRILGMV